MFGRRREVEAELGRASRGRPRSRAPSCRSTRAARAGACRRCGSCDGISARSGPSSRSNQRARSAAKASAAASLARLQHAPRARGARSPSPPRCARPGRRSPESSAASSSPARDQLEPVGVEAALASAWISPSSSRSAYVAEHGELRLRVPQRHLLAVERRRARRACRFSSSSSRSTSVGRRRARPRTSCAAGRAARARRRRAASSASRSASSCSTREEVGVALDDLRLLRRLLLADPDRAALLGALVAGSAASRLSNSVGLRTAATLKARHVSRPPDLPGRADERRAGRTASRSTRRSRALAVRVESAVAGDERRPGSPGARAARRAARRRSRCRGARRAGRRRRPLRRDRRARARRASPPPRTRKPSSSRLTRTEQPERRVVVDDEDEWSRAPSRLAIVVDSARCGDSLSGAGLG